MNKTHLAGFLIAGMFLGLAACGGGDDAPAPAPAPPPPPAGTVIGPAGGTVTGPSGTSVVIPAGALASDTRILIELVTAGAPALPTGFTAGGQMFAFTPHGTTFALPVTMTIPFDPALVPAGQPPGFYKTNAQNQWEKISNAEFDATSVSAQVTGFSTAGVFVPGFLIGRPIVYWEVKELKGAGLEGLTTVVGRSVSQNVAVHYDFGLAARDGDVFSFDDSLVVPPDGVATAQIAATANGHDWSVGAEAPLSRTDEATDTLGLLTEFEQTQSFVKNTSDAVLSYFISEAFMQTSDANGILKRKCPRAYKIGLRCEAISAQLRLHATAFTYSEGPLEDDKTFYRIAGGAEVTGIAGSWDSQAYTSAFSHEVLWDVEDFAFEILNIGQAEEALITMRFADPSAHEYVVDLSSVRVGQSFILHFDASTKAYNRAAAAINNIGSEFETSASAYLRDPRAPQGITISYSGLEPIETPDSFVLPPLLPEEPEPCVPGPGPKPEAGTIQFDAPDYTQSETNITPSITVTRTGGSEGDVTATFATSDGSAVAGIDYTSLSTTVFFADGDDTPRVVTVNAIPNSTSGEPNKTVNLTLSEPGGCAALGGQTTAVLNIQDDDEPPEPPGFTVGGTVTGLVGTGLTLQDHRFEPITPGNGEFTFSLPTQTGLPYEVEIIAQPSNPVQECSIANASGTMGNADVTNIEVSCAPPPSPGGLDPGFGGGTGKVSTAFGGDETDMLLQSDGKILMIGGSGSDFVMARYDTDGSLDETFGDDGLVTTDIAGGLDAAFGAALLGDGRIIVVGSARVDTSDDFAIVRYESNGDVDTSFGTQGKTTTNFFGQRDRAYAVAVQSDNRIVVVGEALLPAGSSDFAVARYDSNGLLDSSFGSAGKVTTDIALKVDIAKNVVIEDGGTILVTGTITMGDSAVLGHTGLARYTSAGVLDNSLGANGTTTIALMSLGEGLALQPDGRIIVMGNAPVGGHAHFAVMRLLVNGTADGSFGLGGLTTVGFSIQDDYGRDIAFDANGRILLSGQTSNLSNPDFAVARLTADGALDTSFDDDGKFTVDFFDRSDSAENVAVQADGKIVLGGFGVNGTLVRYGLARVNP